jgi:hypothetical protein
MNDVKKSPAGHGYRNEVSWDEGKGRQPYGNRSDGEQQQPSGAPEVEGGDAGDAAGRNMDDMEAVDEMPGQAGRDTPRGN